MKSLIKILIVFWISQKVCYQSNVENKFFKIFSSRKLVFSNIFDVLGELNIVENCDKFEMNEIFYKLINDISILHPQ